VGRPTVLMAVVPQGWANGSWALEKALTSTLPARQTEPVYDEKKIVMILKGYLKQRKTWMNNSLLNTFYFLCSDHRNLFSN
jgi:hypothetical protein